MRVNIYPILQCFKICKILKYLVFTIKNERAKEKLISSAPLEVYIMLIRTLLHKVQVPCSKPAPRCLPLF